MQHRIISLEQEGLKLLKDRDYESAASIFSQILAEAPDYEHGACFFHLAVCLEELGQFSRAETNFKKALDFFPDDNVRLGGYASFLYLYGDPRDALQAHLQLLKVYRRQQNSSGEQRTILAIRALGTNLGFSEIEVTSKINSCSAS